MSASADRRRSHRTEPCLRSASSVRSGRWLASSAARRLNVISRAKVRLKIPSLWQTTLLGPARLLNALLILPQFSLIARDVICAHAVGLDKYMVRILKGEVDTRPVSRRLSQLKLVNKAGFS